MPDVWAPAIHGGGDVTIHNEDCLETMARMEPGSVDMVITSPPYNVGIKYDVYDDNRPFDEWLAWLGEVWRACHRVLGPDGRIAINVADAFRSPYIPIHSHVIQQMLDIGFLMRGIIYWRKTGFGSKTAWGSWCSPSNPVLQEAAEYILVFNREEFKLRRDGVSTLDRDGFLAIIDNLWEFHIDPKNTHPASFPIELPSRLINLYTYRRDHIYDPFMGSGSTMVAAKFLDRRYTGSEISPAYYADARRRLAQETLEW